MNNTKKTLLMMLAILACQGIRAQETDTDIYLGTTEKPAVETKQKKGTPVHALTVNVSPGWITSTVYTPRDDYNWQSGMGYEVGYHCRFHSGYGFGLSYSHNSTDYPGGYNLGLTYCGASFLYGGDISKQWSATMEIGIGYANYSDAGVKMKDGLGTKYCIGIEYKITPLLGIGIDVAHHVSMFPKDNSYGFYDSDRIANGFKRLSVNAGLRIHL